MAECTGVRSDYLILHGCIIDVHSHSLLVKGTPVLLSSGNYSSVTNACGVSVAETVEVLQTVK